MQRRVEFSLVPKTIATEEGVEFQIIVRLVAVPRFQNATLATAVTATQHQCFELVRRDDFLNSGQNLFTHTGEVVFQFVPAVERKPRCPVRAFAWTVSCQWPGGLQGI